LGRGRGQCTAFTATDLHCVAGRRPGQGQESAEAQPAVPFQHAGERRRVAQINGGRKTTGIDGKTALLSQQEAELVDWVQHRSLSWTARAVKRVFIPKAGSTKRQRPLGIPVLADRALQARVVNALEPEWEARFESRSYGFRPGRGCHDAIEAIYDTCKGKRSKRVWILDAVWRRRSFTLITITCSTNSGPSRPREWSLDG
jgi:hypothetical protein